MKQFYCKCVTRGCGKKYKSHDLYGDGVCVDCENALIEKIINLGCEDFKRALEQLSKDKKGLLGKIINLGIVDFCDVISKLSEKGDHVAACTLWTLVWDAYDIQTDSIAWGVGGIEKVLRWDDLVFDSISAVVEYFEKNFIKILSFSQKEDALTLMFENGESCILGLENSKNNVRVRSFS